METNSVSEILAENILIEAVGSEYKAASVSTSDTSGNNSVVAASAKTSETLHLRLADSDVNEDDNTDDVDDEDHNDNAYNTDNVVNAGNDADDINDDKISPDTKI